MKFWGTEVKPGQAVSCSVDNDHYIHISQVVIGKTKKGTEKAVVSVKVDDTDVVIGTLSAENHPHFLCDLIFQKEFKLSHSSKTASVFLYGYKVAMHDPDASESSSDEDEDEEEHKNLPVVNLVSDKSKGTATADDGKKDKDVDDTDSDEDDNAESDDDSQFSSHDDDMSEDEPSNEENDTSSEEDVPSSEEDESDEEDIVIPKPENGKKRAAETALKTTSHDKKAKITTPSGQKTGGKKNVHVATPHPTKQTSKIYRKSDGKPTGRK